MGEIPGQGELKGVLKAFIVRLNEGANHGGIREEFRKVTMGRTVNDIILAEEELLKEGVPRKELQRLCDAVRICAGCLRDGRISGGE